MSREKRSPAVRHSAQSLEKALDLLEYLGQSGAPRGARYIAEETDIPKSTVERILEVLVRRGYAKKEDGKYKLWTGAVPLAERFLSSDALFRNAEDIMKELVKTSMETVSLYIRQGFKRILVYRVESPHPLRFFTKVGVKLPLYLGASGMVLCTGVDEEELNSYFTEIAPVTLADGKLLSKEDLMQRVRETAQKGFAIGVNERYEGLTSLAAPVWTDKNGMVAAMNIVGPSYRMDKRDLDTMAIELQYAAKELANRVDLGR